MKHMVWKEFPHLSATLDGKTRTITESCDRCGQSQVYGMLDVLAHGGAPMPFSHQHKLPNCGANGLKDLVQDSIAEQRTGLSTFDTDADTQETGEQCQT